MAGDEIGVEMGQDDVLDGEPISRGEVEVLIDVTLRVDDRGDARRRSATRYDAWARQFK